MDRNGSYHKSSDWAINQKYKFKILVNLEYVQSVFKGHLSITSKLTENSLP